MCTVTFLSSKEGFILSSNRDETPRRSETPLEVEKISDKYILFPKDTKGGSWLLASNHRQAICVLNGAKLKHQHTPPYKESRGVLAKQFFTFKTPKDFFKNVNFVGIEPFTMIIYSHEKLYQFQWDGNIRYIDQLNAKQDFIWSSSTLYDPPMVRQRAEVFQKLKESYNSINLLQKARCIHRNGSVGDPAQNYIMNRNNIVRTVSVSHLVLQKNHFYLEIENLISGQRQKKTLPFAQTRLVG